MRILDQSRTLVSLTQLGFLPETRKAYEDLITMSAGHAPGHRPDREREDDDPVRLAARHQ